MHRRLLALTLAVVASIPTPAAATPRTGRRIAGVVQKTNWQTREVAIVRTDTSEPLRFVLIDRTLFVANGQLANATILEPGAKVEVIYHRPIFGRPFVTRVALLSAPARAAKTGRVIVTWKLAHEPPRIAQRKALRITTEKAAPIHGGFDGFKTANDLASRDTGFSCWLRDLPSDQLPAGAFIRFEFPWQEEWKGRDLEAGIAGPEKNQRQVS